MSPDSPGQRPSGTESTVVSVINAHPTVRLRHAPFVDDVTNVLRSGGVDSGEVRVIFVDRTELLRLNREFLGHDYDTDVITFPIESDPLEGEVYISVEMARTQAGEEWVRFYEEARRLAIHGALHLIGYDDATPEQKRTMRELEDRFLQSV